MDLTDKLFVVATMIIAILTVIGNIVVILAVFSNRRLQNPANFLIVNLAVSDFFQGALTMPIRVAELLNSGDHTLIRCDVVISLTILFHSASNFNLALIALDRFIAVAKPFAYTNVTKTSSYKIVIGVTWLFCLLLSGAPAVGWRIETPENAGAVCRYGTTLTEAYMIMYVCLVDALPMIIMVIAYTYIFRTTRRQISKIRAHEIAVKHAAINQACDYRRASESSVRCGTEAQPAVRLAGAGVDCVERNEDNVAGLAVPTNPAVAEKKDCTEENQETAGNTDNQTGVKSPTDPPDTSNGHVSLDKPQTDHLNTINPELSTMPGETSTVNNNIEHVVKKTLTPKNSNSKNVPYSTTRSRKATKTVLAIIGFFIVLCMPISVIDAIELWCTSCDQVPRVVITIALCMVHSNSSVNVFVYGGYNTDYRKAYWNIWRRVKAVFLSFFARTKIRAQSTQTVSNTQE
jgi:hypothetical protein